MQTTNHFVWNVDPVAFNFGSIPFPFPMAIWGFVAAILIFFLGYSKLTPNESGKTEPEGWKVFALAIGALIIGQLIFMVLPSPTISQIGPIQPRWYGVLFAGAFIAGYFIMNKMMKYGGRTQEELDILLTYVLIATVIGARLGHVIFYDLGYYLRNPSEIIAIWHGGLASHGAAIGIIIAMYLYTRKVKNMNFLWLADRVVIVVALGGAFIRIGNFFNSEIVGKPADLPWAIIFPQAHVMPTDVPRHPSMLYEALLCIVVFILLWTIYKRYKTNPPEGSLFAIFLILLFGGRFFLEFSKVQQAAFATGIINMGQWLSIPLVIIGIWILARKVDWGKKLSPPG